MKLKLRKIGNSLGVLLPKEVTGTLKAGDEIEWGVITEPIEKTEPLIKKYSYEWCNTHNGYKGACGCN